MRGSSAIRASRNSRNGAPVSFTFQPSRMHTRDSRDGSPSTISDGNIASLRYVRPYVDTSALVSFDLPTPGAYPTRVMPQKSECVFMVTGGSTNRKYFVMFGGTP